MITIRELSAHDELYDFVHFPFLLFGDSPYWAPPIISDELQNMNSQKNPVFNHVEARYFIAYRDEQPVGRIAGIINWLEVRELNIPKIRFGYFDCIDDPEVSKALLGKVRQMGKEKELEFMEGPLGFSNMDKAGMLVEGFDEPNTMITWYGLPHYAAHLEQLGYKKEKEWVEYEIQIPDRSPPKVKRFSKLIRERYNLRNVRFSNTKELLKHTDEMFDLINKTYSDLSTYIPIKPDQITHYKDRYVKYLHPDFINCVADEKGDLIAFAITMPSFSKALRKANGKLFPFGWYHLLKARYFPQKAAFYLIGIKPEYQNKGVTSIIFDEMNEVFNQNGITTVETNPELEDNEAIQALWEKYENRLHKRRRTYRDSL
ncbi:GTP cyclohydrolase [Aliifodinibius salipaludis]|uniref:GTP cyclohydrolase n=1 Tax=Fodinibius salipaludis TaxID=2032627 RepID=A0A2A2GA21_9BACT|nr:GNAT family N-acetyltransferase [Aliifodinibius salipaludis]PAU93699.1 GTP cyclohydrolase [Aliifodinibius salipaludis]